MRRLWTAVLALLLVACGGGDVTEPLPPGASEPARGGRSEPKPLEPSEPFGRTTATLVGPAGQRHELAVYDAHQPAARRRGLMGRETLPADAGMVFRMPGPTDGGFWMKNTRIPLSIAFFDGDGEILALRDMQPCTADPCPVYEPGVTYEGALEVNLGRFAELGVRPGWRVELPAGLPSPS